MPTSRAVLPVSPSTLPKTGLESSVMLWCPARQRLMERDVTQAYPQIVTTDAWVPEQPIFPETPHQLEVDRQQDERPGAQLTAARPLVPLKGKKVILVDGDGIALPEKTRRKERRLAAPCCGSLR